jgi:hypothetical protein
MLSVAVQRRPGQRQGGPPQTVHSHQRAERIVAERRALELRLAGASYDQIATTLGLKTRSASYRMVERVLARMVQEPSDQVRALELARLDSWLMRITPLIHQGNLEALDRGLKIMARRAALLGLDLPVKVDMRLQIEAVAQRVALETGLEVQAILEEATRLLEGGYEA